MSINSRINEHLQTFVDDFKFSVDSSNQTVYIYLNNATPKTVNKCEDDLSKLLEDYEIRVKNDFSIELLHDAYYYLKENYTREEIGDHAYQAIHFLRGEKPFENEWRELKNFR